MSVFDGGNKIELTITEDGAKALYGKDATPESVKDNYKVEYLGGVNVEGDDIKETYPNDYKKYEEKIAGTHYYAITDLTTGQMICKKHAVVIEPFEITGDTLSAGTYIGFDGETYTGSVSLSGLGMQGTGVMVATFKPKVDLVYTPQHIESGYSGTVKHIDVSVDGKIVEAINADSSLVTWTTRAIDLNNNKISKELKYALECYVLPRAYTAETSSKTVYYASVTEAINATSASGAIIYPMQQFDYNISSTRKGTKKVATSLTAGDYEHIIDTECTIASGVTLCIPYSTSYSNYFTDSELIVEDRCSYRLSDYLKNEIVVKSVEGGGPTLINYGTIQIPGQVNGGENKHANVSATAGEHSQITLEDNAVISNQSGGKIRCRGFIDAKTFGNGSKVDMVGGEIEVVLSIGEHHGGSTILAISKKKDVVPFNQFFVRSVTTDLIVENDAVVKGFADLSVSIGTTVHANATINLFGKTDGAFMQFSGNKTRAKLTFNPNTNQNILKVEGSVSINKVEVDKDYTVAHITMTTEGIFLPLSHYWDIEFGLYDNETSATVNAKTDKVKQDIKILPGASLVINKGVTLNAGKIAVYSGDALTAIQAGVYNYYVKADGTPAPTNPDGSHIGGVLKVNGTLNVDFLGGYVQVGDADAKIRIASSNEVKIIELAGESDSYATKEVSFTASSQVSISENNSQLKPLIPTSVGNYYISLGDSWFQPFANITLNANGGAPGEETVVQVAVDKDRGIVDLSNTTQNKVLPTWTDYYNFDQWYVDSNCTETLISKASAIKYDTEVFAGWTLNRKTTILLNHNYLGAPSGTTIVTWVTESGVTQAFWNSITTGEHVPIRNAYEFFGWYADPECTQPIDTQWFSDALNIDTGQIEIFAAWKALSTKGSVTYNYNVGDKNFGDADMSNKTIEYAPGTIVTLPTEHSVDEERSIQYYLVGWKDANGKDVTSISIVEDQDIVVYAQWETKVKVTLDVNNTELTLAGLAPVWLKPSNTAYNVQELFGGVYGQLDDNDTNVDKKYYFKGLDTNTITPVTGECVVKALWGQKHKISLSASISHKNCTGSITVKRGTESWSNSTKSELWFNPNETVTIEATLKGYYRNYYIYQTRYQTQVKVDGEIMATEHTGSLKSWNGGKVALTENGLTAIVITTVDVSGLGLEI